MNISFDVQIAKNYHSASQIARVLTEAWVDNEVYCPNCGLNIEQYENGRPVADFYCPKCREEYELKSKRDAFGIKVVDGDYEKMIERLQSANNPNFFLLNYNVNNLSVLNFLVIPKHFFIPEIIEKRKPLSETARRSEWVGCNILLQTIPESGKIFYIKNGQIEKKENILNNWRKTLFLRESNKTELKGWILDIMKCIDNLGKKEFSIHEIYNFENSLSKKHPDNRHIKDKIRQQLQFLRDKGYLEFVDKGKYKVV